MNFWRDSEFRPSTSASVSKRVFLGDLAVEGADTLFSPLRAGGFSFATGAEANPSADEVSTASNVSGAPAVSLGSWFGRVRARWLVPRSGEHAALGLGFTRSE